MSIIEAIERVSVVESADEYHANRGRYVTSSSLRTFQKSPAKFYHEWTTGESKEQTQAMRFGTAAHTLILEGNAKFREEYEFAANAPVNDKTGKPYGVGTAKHNGWMESHGKKVLTASEEKTLMGMQNNSPYPSPLTDVEGGTVFTERSFYIANGRLSVPAMARIDRLIVKERKGLPALVIVEDYKTCADLDGFPYDIKKFDYVMQLAFYSSVLIYALKPNSYFHIEARLVAQEKSPPYIFGMWDIQSSKIGRAVDAVALSIADMATCFRTGVWKTGYEHPLVVADDEY